MKNTTVYPEPQVMIPGSDCFLSGENIRINASSAYASVANLLAVFLTEHYGIAADRTDAGDAEILVGSLEDASVMEYLQKSSLALKAQLHTRGGYVLAVSPEKIVIAGYDLEGMVFGFQTLRQLIEPGEKPGTVQVGTVVIQDWPYKKVRGMHMYMPARKEIPFFKRLLDWMSSMKMNTLFLEVSGGMKYDRHPEINAGWEKFCKEADAFPDGAASLYNYSTKFMKDSTHTELGGGSYLEKAEVADILAYAHTLQIEIIPEVQALSHSYYLCCSHPEIAELSFDRYPDTYCPSNPLSYELLFDCMEEVIEVFNPRILHIGHDEIYHMGVCPRCQGKTGSELLSYELNKIHTFLAEHGVRMAMWCDKLLPFDAGGQGGVEIVHEDKEKGFYTKFPETYHAIEGLPRDILMAEWLGNRDSRAIDFMLQSGFEVYCGNFGDNFEAHAFMQWDERSKPAGLVGGESSSWCEVSEYNFGYHGVIFNAIFSAWMLWREDYHDADRYQVAGKVVRRMPAVRTALSGQAGPFEGMASRSLPLAGASPVEFSAGRTGVVIDEKQPECRVSVGGRAAGLRFTHTCSTDQKRLPVWARPELYQIPPEDRMAVYRVLYQDGSAEEIPVDYGTNIARWDLPFSSFIDAVPYRADLVMEGTEIDPRQPSIYTCEWVNPQPDRVIQSLAMAFDGQPGARVWVLDVSLVESQVG
jgi:hexosaminidase